MSIFDHQHRWYPNIMTNFVVAPPGETPADCKECIFPQQCRCGAVRTVEIAHGEAPVIRMGLEK